MKRRILRMESCISKCLIGILIFAGAVAFSWLIYHSLIKWYSKRVDLEKNFAPLLAPRRKRPVPRNQGKDSKE